MSFLDHVALAFETHGILILTLSLAFAVLVLVWAQSYNK